MAISRQAICRVQRVPYSRRTLLEESTIYKAAVFFRFCKPATQVGSRESFTSQIIRQTQFLHATQLSLWFAQVDSIHNNILMPTLHRLICMLGLLLGSKVQQIPIN